MKHIHRFFISSPLATGETAALDDDDSFHAASVLRLRPGDAIELADPKGHVFNARITRSEGIVEARADGEQLVAKQVPLTIAQAVPKGKKMDLIVEKLSELGVAVLVPIHADMSVARQRAVSAEKLKRWRRIAKAAASQSRRPDIMRIEEPRELGEWLEETQGPVVALVTEEEGQQLGGQIGVSVTSLALVIGPESGFSEREIGLLSDSQAAFASLGPLILRTETAAMVAATVIMHRLGAIG